MDDTVLSLLAQNTDSITAAAVHEQMQQYVNDEEQKANAIDKSYRQYKAYSVWYGSIFRLYLIYVY